MKPEIGKRYRKNGFEFRVDYIDKGQVYYVRWRDGEKDGELLRVDIEDWERQMGESE